MKTFKGLMALMLALILLIGSVPAVSAEGNQIQNVTISSDGIMTWDPFPDADKYWLRCDHLGRWVEKNSIDLNNECTTGGLESGTVTITLKAYQGEYISSETWTGTYEYTAPERIADPTGLKWIGLTAVWDPVPNAQYYTISLYRDKTCVNNYNVLETNHFDLSDWIKDVGTYEYYFTVHARADGYLPAKHFATSETKTITIPGPAEKHYIFDVAVNVTEPREGEKPSYEAVIPDGGADYSVADYEYAQSFRGGVGWRNEDGWLDCDEFDGFEAGKSYTVQVILNVNNEDTDAFPDTYYIDAKINGKPAHVSPISDAQIAVSCSFTATEVVDPYEVSDILLNVTTANAGEKPAYSASVGVEDVPYRVESEYSDDAGYRNGVCWMLGGAPLDPNKAVLIAGRTYTAIVSVVLTDESYHFSNKGVTASVNGQDATAAVNSGYALVYCDFTVSGPGGTPGYIVGDVNDSGAVDNRDAMILDRYVAEWAGYDAYIKNMDAADMDRKGTVDNRDAIILDRVAAGWAGYYEKYCITAA